MRNAIGYIRVSTNAQDDKYGKEAQKEAIVQYASEHNIKIVQWLTDVVSGVKEVRPSWNVILSEQSDVSNPPYDCVIVFKSDRVARDVKLFFYYEFLLRKKNIELFSVNDDFANVPDAFKDIMKSLVIFMAEQERNNITLRTSAGRKIKADKGGYAGGRCPYGYESVGGSLQVCEAQAQVIKTIFLLRDTQHFTYEGIADYLNDNHIYTQTGKLWQKATIKYVLDNRKFYQGYIKYGKNAEYIKGEHEAIINED